MWASEPRRRARSRTATATQEPRPTAASTSPGPPVRRSAIPTAIRLKPALSATGPLGSLQGGLERVWIGQEEEVAADPFPGFPEHGLDHQRRVLEARESR